MSEDWSQTPLEGLKKIRGVCLDIDDTLSTHGKLTDQAYAALWSLHRAGFFVVPITGRPAGWCDHIARFWPVHAVVGENGAFTFYMDGGVRRRLDTPSGLSQKEAASKLGKLGEAIQKGFPHALWASDQAYREYDLAIDFCEDVPPWAKEDVEALLKLCADLGAHAKLSSIHVNAWYGDYDKRAGFDHWLEKGAPGLGAPAPKSSEWLFIGDSPNDEPLFKTFSNSVGVANLKPFLNRLQSHPRWLTPSESGAGFSEMAARLIQAKA